MPAAGGKFWNCGIQESKEILQKRIENTVETTENRFLEGGYRQHFLACGGLLYCHTAVWVLEKYVKKLY